MDNIKKGKVFFIDNHELMNYEIPSNLNRFFNHYILIPILLLFPNIGRLFLIKSSRDARVVYDNVKTSTALEVLYNYGINQSEKTSLFEKIFTFLWQHSIFNAKGVRNRFKLVENELINSINQLSHLSDDPIKIISLASGSARVIIKVLTIFKKRGIKLDVKLLDLSEEALMLSEKIAKENDVFDMITLCHDKASNFLNYCLGWKPDIIEMVGFMDYLNQTKAINLSSKIYNILKPEGYFITANILDNNERHLMTNVFHWDMIYRSKEELLQVLIESGFDINQCKVTLEPTLIHAVAIGKK